MLYNFFQLIKWLSNEQTMTESKTDIKTIPPMGRVIARLLNWLFPQMDDWRDPQWVWQFQKRFGVQKVKVVENKPGEPFQPVDYDAYMEKQKLKMKDEKR